MNKKASKIGITFLISLIFIASIPLMIFGSSSSDNSVFASSMVDGEGIYKIVEDEMNDYLSKYSSSRGQKYRNWIAYGDETGNKGKAVYFAWCATFASYIIDAKLSIFKREELADKSAKNLMNKLRNKNLEWHDAGYTPKPGDVGCWVANNGQGHVGFATGDGGAETGHFISGNWADSVKLGKIRNAIQDAGTTKYPAGYITLPYQNGNTIDASSITGSDKKETIWNIMRKSGFSKESAAAVMGNIQQEKADWNEASDSSSGLGLLQLTSGRAASCRSYCQRKYGTPYSYKGQIEFMINIDAPGQFKSYTGYERTYKNHIDQETNQPTIYGWKTRMSFDNFKQQSSEKYPLEVIKTNAIIWCRVYERAGQPLLSKRQKYAIEYYNLYKNN